MRIWLIKEGETLPLNESVRLERTGSLAQYLSVNGHEVVWWGSTFDHRNKRYRFESYTEANINENETVALLHSKVSYKKNISLARIRYHKILGKEFTKYSLQKEKPDIIVCSWPTPQFAEAAVQYGRENHVPVLLDIRDLWPDIYVRAFPKKLEPLANLMLLPIKKRMARTIKGADGIIGKEPHALNWGCNYAGRKHGDCDTYIYIGNEKFQISDSDYVTWKDWWKQLGVTENTWNMCFFSTLSYSSIDLETVIKAVMRLSATHPELRLVIGGTGDAEEKLKAVAANSSNVVFAGWLNKEQMNTVMKMSKLGLYSMRNTDDFKESITNKAIQYMSAGLPILNSLTGLTNSIIEEYSIGFTYEEGNVDDCAEKILRLYDEETQRQTMGMRAEMAFNELFESNLINHIFEDHLKKVVSAYNSASNKPEVSFVPSGDMEEMPVR